MTKIRIYELAKELGVENKVVIQKAQELGMEGRTSHSHALEGYEVDQLRKAFALNKNDAASTGSSKSEKVTTRVDKSTGNKETILESRSGNLIRRRRTEPTSATTAEVPPVELAVPAVSEDVLPQQVVEPEVTESDTVETTLTSSPITEEVETAPVEVPAPVAVEPEVAEVEVVEAPVTTVQASTVAAPDKKVGIGPKILGKISLPVKRIVPQKTAITKAVPSKAVLNFDDDGGKKKVKRVEFSRGDLLDYSGREGKGRRKKKEGMQQQEVAQPAQKIVREVKMADAITVGELARQLSLKAGQVIAKLIELGVMATINQQIDFDTASIIVEEFGGTIVKTSFDETEILETAVVDDPSKMTLRPPIVTVMGHVDHGKTSLLDAIRNASVASREHGGITQHIGAYQVELPDHRKITFIDTPGHAAFTAMRARGAHVTDIVILVVAADDGPMPQTIEALNHAKAANVPVIVAVNKMDRPDANIEKVKQKLVEHGLQPEDWGGDTMYFPVSAMKKTGIEQLLEGVLILAEVKELKADPSRRARGTVVDARQERGRGTVATVLVQSGTLRVGEMFVCGASFGRVKTILNEHAKPLIEAPPSTPVEVTGFGEIPSAGDDFFVVENEAKAREVAQNRIEKQRIKDQASASGPISLEEFAKRANQMAAAELNVILKADVHGSVEAVKDAIEKLTTDKVKVKVLHAAVGGINESDVQLASASNAVIVGFGVRAEARAAMEAETRGIDMRYYKIIYELIDDIKKAMTGLLAPIKKEVRLGRAEVRQTFMLSKVGIIAGSHVSDGVVKRGSVVRLLRDSKLVFEGKLSSLRRFKDDAREVSAGYECGIGIENFNDVKPGDIMEFFEIEEVAATL